MTAKVWCPWNVASRTTSRHHLIDVMVMVRSPRITSLKLPVWNHTTVPEVNIRAPKAAVKGQGLWSTRWKGC